ncbi:retrovirus-related pol polyprotein from transposon TNT 1-94 [Tanacetum coccineum]|uniref:Retrovirus-related pol polyprotein from transposon TNT 1-94 n=1 Tax=Tanacetum coccineum TaxID=301880 RepID=A0ABQ5D7X6_9ASTR
MARIRSNRGLKGDETINIELVHTVNIKSAEISDLNASLQEKALAITALKDELRKLKKCLKKDSSLSYIKHSQEEAAVLRDLVDHIKANYPLDPLLESACNTKKDKIQQTPSSTLKNKVEAHPRKVKSSLKNKDCVVAPKGTAHVQHSKLNANYELKCVKYLLRKIQREKFGNQQERCLPILDISGDLLVIQIVLWYLDSGCSKHMTGDRSQLTNFVSKFLGTVKFGNDHVAKIMGYGDYQIGNMIFVRLKKPSDAFTKDNGMRFVNQTLKRNYYERLASLRNIVARSPQRKTMLLKEEIVTLLKQVATLVNLMQNSFSSLGRSVSISLLYQNSFHDTPSTANLRKKLQPKFRYSIFIGYAPTKKAFRIYNRRTRRIVETIHVDFDELTAMASEHSSSGPALHEMTPATISSGLVPNPHPSTPFIPPSRTDWDILFQPLFDEFLNPSPSVDHPAPEVVVPINEVIAPVLADSTGSPSSTTVDQDAPSPSNSQTTPKTEPPVIPNDVEEDNHDIEVAHMGNDPYFGVPIPESLLINLHHRILFIQLPVSTRLQLHEQALFCYYDAFLTAVEPKTYKDALTQACWIKAMQEELNEFDQLKLLGLVPTASYGDYLKWILKVKLDEMGGILKNKARLVARSYWISTGEKIQLDEDKEEKAVDPSQLHGTVHRGLWYPKDSSIALTAFADADHASCQDTRRSTSVVCNFWVIDLLAGRLKGKKKRLHISRKLNILLLFRCCAQFLWYEITAYRTRALDSINSTYQWQHLHLCSAEIELNSVQQAGNAKFLREDF